MSDLTFLWGNYGIYGMYSGSFGTKSACLTPYRRKSTVYGSQPRLS
jgi:hypothetical protein